MKKENVRNVNTFQLFMVVLLMFLATCKLNAQLKVGNNPKTINSNTILEMESTNKGMLLPRMALSATNSFAPMTAHVAGMTVYNTATVGNVTPGFYYNDGSQWIRIDNESNRPWFNVATNSSATSNTQDIYQMGNVGIGISTPNASAQLDLNSTSRGFLLPRMTSVQRKAIVSPAIGLQVYDTDLKGVYIFNNTWDCLNTPAGTVMYYAKSTPPNGYLIANGQEVNRTTYAELFNAIGTTFGVGNGTTTFKLPDLRAEFIRGIDNSRGIDVSRVFGSSQLDEFENHNHDGNTVSGSNAFGDGFAGAIYYSPWQSAPNPTSGGGRVNMATGFRGGTETRPRNVALLPIIKF